MKDLLVVVLITLVSLVGFVAYLSYAAKFSFFVALGYLTYCFLKHVVTNLSKPKPSHAQIDASRLPVV